MRGDDDARRRPRDVRVAIRSGVVVGRVAGVATFVAPLLVPLGVASVVLSLGNERLSRSGVRFGIDARRARTVVVERGRGD